jgi:hypothetical protein
MVNFINILRAGFLYESAFLPKSFCQSQNLTREKLCKALLYEKCARKMLMKFIPNLRFQPIFCFNIILDSTRQTKIGEMQ